MGQKWGPTLVQGNPVGYGIKEKEEPWKERIVEVLLSAWGRSQLQVPLRARLHFSLAEIDPNGRYNYDITGLLECAVNAVGHVMTPPSKRGGHPSRWNHQDHWIEDIHGSKALAQSKTGVEITLEEI